MVSCLSLSYIFFVTLQRFIYYIMNYYVRYFDSEGVFSTVADLKDFVASIPRINMTDDLAQAIQQFCDDNTNYPRHFRLPNKTTFIIIKTNAQSLEEFKLRGANGGQLPQPVRKETPAPTPTYDELRPGMYEVTMVFRRAFVNPETGKCHYADDEIVVNMLSQSQRQCYDVLVEYLRGRDDVDSRSQFPGIRSENFKAAILSN